ncbi:hypothetical protein [Bdellovibrio sp. HCB-162]|uniref:hypothetical protein n=1 Tax=Bdellovibrio sp. HCB-162 TaxID=3394234 RepID=UPI0039BC9D82
MNKILKAPILVFSTLCLSMGACSFKKDGAKTNNGKVTIEAVRDPQLCENTQPQTEDLDIVSLSTSTKPDDLCLVWSQLRNAETQKALLSVHQIAFSNLIKSMTEYSESIPQEKRKLHFKNFLQWSIKFSNNISKPPVQDLIALNNRTSNYELNSKIVSTDFIEKKLHLYIDTDHFSLDEFAEYTDALAKKISLQDLCSQDSLKLALRRKILSSHTLHLLQTCRATYDLDDILALRAAYLKPVNNSELLTLQNAIDSHLLILKETSTWKETAVVVSLAIKRLDTNLFKLAQIAYEKKNNLLFSMAFSKEFQYDVEKFVSISNQNTLIKTLTSREILEALRLKESAELFSYFSKYDIIPSSEVTFEVLKEIKRVRTESPFFYSDKAVVAFLQLLKSNLSTGYRTHSKNLELAAYERRLLMHRQGSEIILNEFGSVPFGFLTIAFTSDQSFDLSSEASTKLFPYTMGDAIFRKLYVDPNAEVPSYIHDRALNYAPNGSIVYSISAETLFASILDAGKLKDNIKCNPIEAASCTDSEKVYTDFLKIIEAIRKSKPKFFKTN